MIDKTKANPLKEVLTIEGGNLPKPQNLIARIKNIADRALDSLGFARSCGYKAAALGKYGCYIGGETSPDPKTRGLLNRIAKKLGLISVSSIPFNLKDAGMSAFTIKDEIKTSDFEGATLSMISLGLLLGDTFDNIMTAADWLVKVESNPVLSIASQAVLPLCLVLTSVSTAVKGYRLTITGVELYRLNKKLKEKDLNAYTEYMNKLIGITKEEEEDIRAKLVRLNPEELTQQFEKEKANLLKLKTSRLQRRSNKKAAEILSAIVKNPEAMKDPKQVEEALKQLKAAMIKTTCVHSANILANMLSLAGLALFFAPVPPIAPLVLLAVSATMKLAIMVFERYAFDPLLDRFVKVDELPKERKRAAVMNIQVAGLDGNFTTEPAADQHW